MTRGWRIGLTIFAAVVVLDLALYFLGTPQISAALDVIPNPATGGVAGVATGAAVCRSALPNGPNPTCVPWNIYAPGGVTAEQLAYLSVREPRLVPEAEREESGAVLCLTYRADGSFEPVAFMLSLPDYNTAIAPLKGLGELQSQA